MSDTVELGLDEVDTLARQVLEGNGFAPAHVAAIADLLVRAQYDECQSHGLYRLLGMVAAREQGVVAGDTLPTVHDQAPAIVKVDAHGGFSPLAFERGLPSLVAKARQNGLAAMAINHCFHFTALWPEVERIAEQGLVGLAMTPSHSWVAPHGGIRGLLGTNPLAFAWPRANAPAYVFDFATSAVARGEIELRHRSHEPLEPGWALDGQGQPTRDAEAALAGAMQTFGGHKGSALATMIELLAGPLIGDLTSAQSQAWDAGRGAPPYHGELVLALDARVFGGAIDAEGAERLFAGFIEQGARLPSQRRRAARERSYANGYVTLNAALVQELRALA
ncbi:malate/l-lactate dehydrogenase [Salinisphaera sp. T5B8]|uniref:Ldh family oxidoreductase n=1 Tax=unclassified Salinisphaera TaxID=2649847 RepID=UPI000C40CC76|nr:Ldh family oxidoreductase [Salinisphaera sp.]MBS61897.1 oxidoreductase [Salinisphaera sp.]